MLYAIMMTKGQTRMAKPDKIIIKERMLTVPEKTLITESPFILLNERMHSISMHDNDTSV